MGRTPEVLIDIYLSGDDHLPHGDPISSSRYWLINQSLPPRDWLWFEPWGKSLDENHYWLPQPHLDPPDITLKNGHITLVNTGRSAQWIDTLLSTTPFPLVDTDDKHLHFHHHSPISYGGELYHWHSYTFKLEKDSELWTLEAIISNGLHWPPLNSDCGTTPLGSCFFEGLGPAVFDLTDKWIHVKDTGTIETFSMAYIDPNAKRIKDPILSGVISIDGAYPRPMGFMHFFGEMTKDEIKIDMRVKAVWKPENEREGAITDIKYFRPLKEGEE